MYSTLARVALYTLRGGGGGRAVSIGKQFRGDEEEEAQNTGPSPQMLRRNLPVPTEYVEPAPPPNPAAPPSALPLLPPLLLPPPTQMCQKGPDEREREGGGVLVAYLAALMCT